MYRSITTGVHHLTEKTSDKPGAPFADVRAELSLDIGGDAVVHIWSNARVFAFGKATVYVYGNAHVFAFGEAQVFSSVRGGWKSVAMRMRMCPRPTCSSSPSSMRNCSCHMPTGFSLTVTVKRKLDLTRTSAATAMQ